MHSTKILEYQREHLSERIDAMETSIMRDTEIPVSRIWFLHSLYDQMARLGVILHRRVPKP